MELEKKGINNYKKKKKDAKNCESELYKKINP